MYYLDTTCVLKFKLHCSTQMCYEIGAFLRYGNDSNEEVVSQHIPYHWRITNIKLPDIVDNFDEKDQDMITEMDLSITGTFFDQMIDYIGFNGFRGPSNSPYAPIILQMFKLAVIGVPKDTYYVSLLERRDVVVPSHDGSIRGYHDEQAEVDALLDMTPMNTSCEFVDLMRMRSDTYSPSSMYADFQKAVEFIDNERTILADLHVNGGLYHERRSTSFLC